MYSLHGVLYYLYFTSQSFSILTQAPKYKVTKRSVPNLTLLTFLGVHPDWLVFICKKKNKWYVYMTKALFELYYKHKSECDFYCEILPARVLSCWACEHIRV